MKDLNSLSISGRLTKDCEAKAFDSNNLLTFVLASNYSTKKGNEWVDDVNYLDVKMWVSTKSTMDEWLLKGVKVAIQGELRQERWQDKEGKQSSRMVLMAKDIVILSKPNDSTSNSVRGNASLSAPIDDNDIPF